MSKWTKTEKKLPDTDRKVIALSGHDTLLAWAEDGEWYIAAKIKLGGVTKWREMPGEPKDFEYWLHWLENWWGNRKTNAQQVSGWLSGWSSSQAQIGKKVTFYKDSSGRIMTGMPENLPAPMGYEKIVCGSAREAERYSSLQRQQEGYDHRRQQEERGAIEGQFRDEIRSEMRTKMANARNPVNREFMRRALERMDNKGDPTAYQRESYLHAEGFEKNH